MTLAISQSGTTDMLSSSIVQCYNQTGDNRASCFKEASNKVFKIAADSVQNSSILNNIKDKTYVTYAPYTDFSLLQAAYGAPEPADNGAYCRDTDVYTDSYAEAVAQGCPDDRIFCWDNQCEKDREAYLSGKSLLDPDKPWDNVSFAFVTNDGMLIGYESPIKSDDKTIGFYFMVDTNNQKLPNKIGSDLFRFLINNKGQAIDRTCEFTDSCGE